MSLLVALSFTFNGWPARFLPRHSEGAAQKHHAFADLHFA